MTPRTVDWTTAASATARAAAGAGRPEGLRERKKRLMRQQLSDTATEMFVERGFDAVRVAEIAEACGVSEKTVFNYFPTKESLVLDRWDATMTALRTGLADDSVPPVETALRILVGELHGMTAWLDAQTDTAEAVEKYQRFGTLLRSTPSLRAHQRDMTDQLVAATTEILARRIGAEPDDPEAHIAATALIGLWDVQFRALRKHLVPSQPPADVRDAVTADVTRAARLLETGLVAFATPG
jgi:AcrR family transcriptional regulator